jgi:UDP-N-acetylmuramoyl-L-alanyl-D-glutamate--2,6-diaminopimelate ligase
VYGHPSFSLEVIGVTGTNGKTTTTHLLRSAIDAALGSEHCGLIGTVAHGFRGSLTTATHTTPEADELQRLLLDMKRAGATHAAMEVSSIAVALGRVRTVKFRVAALTNLTPDHLDFHRSMAEYGEAKARLFLEYGPGTSVLCVDNDLGRSLVDRIRAPIVRVSARIGSAADVRPTHIDLSSEGIRAELETPGGMVELRSPLVGVHNLENLVVTLGCVIALELDVQKALQGIATCVGAPGRLERVSTADDDIAAFIDYAHTPDALERVLDAVRASARGRIVCVFGCGGDRDAQKRGPMGAAVAARADVAVITSDNPRTEDERAIAAPIVDAVSATRALLAASDISRHRGYVVELDRARAIDLAIAHAAPSDVVVIAGKGHEDYQIVGTEKRHFDDREHARAALARRRGT